MNRFENMDTFIKVVETGSISAAADKLLVAKSAVSRRLKDLEAHLGVELFHRTTRQMNLTETGREFYHHAVRIIEDTIEAERLVSDAHSTLRGSIKMTLPLSFGLMHLAPAIHDFAALHPEIEFNLDFNDREIDLIEQGFDLAIRIARLPDSSLIARRVTEIRVVVCASPDYLKKNGTPEEPAELDHHQCLVYNLMSDQEHWHFFDDQQKQIKTRIRAFLKASNGEFLRDAAINGLGITLIPTFLIYQELANGSLVTLFDHYHFPAINAYAVYPQTRYLSRRVRTFVEFLVERFAGTPYWDNNIV